MYTYISMHICICIHTYISKYVCTHTYTYIYIYVLHIHDNIITYKPQQLVLFCYATPGGWIFLMTRGYYAAGSAISCRKSVGNRDPLLGFRAAGRADRWVL